MEQGGVANADPETLIADKEVSSNTKTSQKEPDELKDSLTEVSGSLEDLVTVLDKPAEKSQEHHNLHSPKDKNLNKDKKDVEPSITSTMSSVRRAEYKAAVAELKEQEEFKRQEAEIELELEMKKIEIQKKKQIADVKRKTQLKADLRKLDTEFSDKSSTRSSSTITGSSSLPFADDRRHLTSWLDSLNGYDEQMITNQNHQSEVNFNKLSQDMQKK